MNPVKVTVSSGSPPASTSPAAVAEAVVTVPAALSMKNVNELSVEELALSAWSTLGSKFTTTSVEPTVSAFVVVTVTSPLPSGGNAAELTSRVVTGVHVGAMVVVVAVVDVVVGGIVVVGAAVVVVGAAMVVVGAAVVVVGAAVVVVGAAVVVVGAAVVVVGAAVVVVVAAVVVVGGGSSSLDQAPGRRAATPAGSAVPDLRDRRSRPRPRRSGSPRIRPP